MTDPIRPTDDAARALARRLIADARHGALAVTDAELDQPMVSRIAIGTAPDGTPVTLVSDLARHTRALHADPTCSLLLGEPGPKGDPLTHPRLTLQARVRFTERNTSAHEKMVAHYLRDHPKAKLYIGFGDFHFARFHVTRAFLNGGFGKAFELTPGDLGLPAPPREQIS